MKNVVGNQAAMWAMKAGVTTGSIVVAERLWRQNRRVAAIATSTPRPRGTITSREREVLRMVAQGLNDRRMAERLKLSEHTIHRHVSNILTKLDASSRSAAVARAMRDSLI